MQPTLCLSPYAILAQHVTGMEWQIFESIILFSSKTVPTHLLTNTKHIDVGTAKKLMAQNPRPLVVDVRTQEEYNEGHIPGAILVPIDEIRNGHFEKLEDKNQVLLIYCRTGRRAEDAAEILAEEGYSKVYEFGGIVDWEEDTQKTDGK